MGQARDHSDPPRREHGEGGGRTGRRDVSGIPSRRRQVIGFLIGMAVTAVVVFLVTTVGAVRTTQQTNAPKIDNTATTLKLVKDCVLPSGTCYQRGQRQTAKAIGSINTGTR